MKLVFGLAAATLLCSFAAKAQEKKIINHEAYGEWESIQRNALSDDGSLLYYVIKPYKGDGKLILQLTSNLVADTIERGEKASLSADGKYALVTVDPGYDTIRQCELKKVDKKKWPKDSVFLYTVATSELVHLDSYKAASFGNETARMALLLDSNDLQQDPQPKRKKKWQFWKSDPEPVAKKESKGKVLVVYDFQNTELFRKSNVMEYQFSEKDNYLLYTVHLKVDTVEHEKLWAYNFSTGEHALIDSTGTDIGPIKTSHNEQYLAYLQTADTGEVKNHRLKLYDLRDKQAYNTIDSNFTQVGSGRAISANQSLIFTRDDSRLFFGVADAEVKEPEDTLTKAEKATLDLWHYDDKRLQPQQLLEQKRDEKSSDLYVLNLDNFLPIQLEKDGLETYASERIIGDYIVVRDISPYEHTYNWAVPRLRDDYRIDLRDGETKLLRQEAAMGGDLSPSGTYYTYFNHEQGQHYIVNVDENSGTCMSCSRTDVIWTSDNNGMPFVPYPHGVMGFNEDETKVYIQSRYDVWVFDLKTRNLTSLTKEDGRKNKRRMNLEVWSRDSVYVTASNTYLKGFDETTKDESVYNWMERDGKYFNPLLYKTAHTIGGIYGAKNGKEVLFRQASFQDYPDLHLTNRNFKSPKKISNANPQQAEYNWATVELMDYTSYDSLELQALVYKPENFDPNKSYPLMVYFYELYTDRFHGHYPPKPTASIIYPTEYASAGYVVLIPDIRYKEGHPGQSAYDCIMASTDAVLAKYPNIDSTRMGLQGQSWGGYQTAQMVTMTKRYAAAMAGAPVANMFSAYGGIRWGSGLNRQFQYERTQSRIGKTIWEAPELYIENSPLFHLPKVETPLLIMHNDDDGAVPWYQGIELFTGMKRLGKTAWMLNYNGDKHNLMIPANRMDLSIRMRQFFDYYLQDAPIPRWMEEGIPAMDKGKDYKLDLLEE